jgi:hypothetical protein
MHAIKLIGALLGAMIVVVIAVLWWAGRAPRRPTDLSPNALYIERGVVPFKLPSTGEWLDCWFDDHERVDRCKLTDKKGTLEFEDVFLPYDNQPPPPQTKLVLDRRRTGQVWTGSYEKGTLIPVVYLTDGEILLPRSEYEKSKPAVDWSKGRVVPRK